MYKQKLFCFPHAGGSAVGYMSWRKKLNPNIELIPMELAGRGMRANKKLYNSFGEAVADLTDVIKNRITDDNYAFLGHSLGSLLAFEISKELLKTGYPSPNHMFLSGHLPPQTPNKRVIYNLTNCQFIKEIVNIGGTPPDIFQNLQFFEYYMPVLRSDFKIHDTYVFKKGDKLPCDFTILYGSEDMTHSELSGWAEHTSQTCSFYKASGGHMFLPEDPDPVIQLINQRFQSLVKTSPENVHSYIG